jgi:hypothetical protein
MLPPVHSTHSGHTLRVAVLDCDRNRHCRYMEAMPDYAVAVCMQSAEEFLEYVQDNPDISTLVIQANCLWRSHHHVPAPGVCRALLVMLRQQDYAGRIIIVSDLTDQLNAEFCQFSCSVIGLPEFFAQARKLINFR